MCVSLCRRHSRVINKTSPGFLKTFLSEIKGIFQLGDRLWRINRGALEQSSNYIRLPLIFPDDLISRSASLPERNFHLFGMLSKQTTNGRWRKTILRLTAEYVARGETNMRCSTSAASQSRRQITISLHLPRLFCEKLLLKARCCCSWVRRAV